MHSAKALWHISKTVSTIQSVAPFKYDGGTILVKSKYSLISTGTERLIAKGLINKEMYNDMAVPHMEGDFDFPIKYGYSLVAEVAEENHPLQGQLVHLLHPHQDLCKTNVSDLHIIPESIPAARASLASNVETVVNAIWDGKVSIGDKVLVVGFGIIGALLSHVLSMMPGVELHILEKDSSRIALGSKFGSSISNELNTNNFDVAFNTSISAEGLQTCIDSVGKEGKIVELSWYGKRTVKLQLGKSFHNQRKQIISSQVGSIPMDHQLRWDFTRRKQLVFKLLEDEAFDQFITHYIPFDESPKFFDELRAGKVEGLGHCIVY